DFINTGFGVGDARRDWLDSDAAVQDWLSRAGLPSAVPGGGHRGLLKAAIALREAARSLVETRKAGGHGDPAIVNRMLRQGGAYSELLWEKGQAPVLLSHRHADAPVALLVPVAESLARLLAEADFGLVRACESADCTLWFYDQTRSHHRRWCSMARCGNRHKVAEFRARQRKP
ncbi:MAG: ABATE domain-containing protein, partial [Nevskia sp.]|nr:ABATE domain-containing protein [Nevskia sp.]